MPALIVGFIAVSPLWTLISVALGAADLPGSEIAMACAYTALGISLFLISLVAIIRRRTA